MRLSIIIPVLDESDHIRSFLQNLIDLMPAAEIIVVDGGSVDDTFSVASELVTTISSGRGRSLQMNTGASVATGDVFLFLHADTSLPEDAAVQITDVIASGASWGRFDVRLSGSHYMFRVIERMMNWRSCLTAVATGDQAIFVTHDLFESVGGYAEIPLMEDIELSKRLRRVSRCACLHARVVTSSRRWEQNGILRTMLLMWRLRFLYFLGAPAHKLAAQYR